MSLRILAACAALILSAGAALAQHGEPVEIGRSRALLIRPKSPQASLILMPGGDGIIGVSPSGDISRGRGNSLVRTAEDFVARRFAVLIVDADVDLRAAVEQMRALRRPVVVAATSRGTLRAAEGVARGARPDRLVLTSGMLSPASGDPGRNVMSILGSPDALPPTLIVHHRQDGCRVTLPVGVDPFLSWAKGKARAVWIDGGVTEGRPCGAHAHHGFNGVEARMVAAVAGFH